MNNQHFRIHHSSRDHLQAIVLEDLTGGTRAEILPDHGALLNRFSLPDAKTNGRFETVAGYSSAADIARNELLFYRSAKLSPFVCRTFAGRYRIGEKNFEFPKKFADGSAIHGILSDKPFSVIRSETSDNGAVLLLRHEYGGNNPGYPFPFALSVKYTLKENGRLCVATLFENLSPEMIPVADGWHPYFSLGGQVGDWQLQLNCGEMLELNAQLVPSGLRKPVAHFRNLEFVGDMTLDNCFVVDPGRGEKPAAVLYNPENRLQLSFFPENTYPFLQLYTPDDRFSIAIENLSSAPDSFNNGIGLVRLAPGAKQAFTVTYQLEQTELQ